MASGGFGFGTTGGGGTTAGGGGLFGGGSTAVQAGGGSTGGFVFGGGNAQTGASLFGGGGGGAGAGGATLATGGGFGTSLFGSSVGVTPGTTGQFGAQQPAGAGGFGRLGATTSTPAGQSTFGGGGGLFSTPAATTGGSLFGGTGTTGGTGLFGGGTLTQQQQPATGSSFGLFGQSPARTTPAFSFGQTSLTSPQQQQQQQQQYQAALSASIPGPTPFGQLPEDLKTRLLGLEKYIKEQRLASARLDQKLGTSEDSLYSVKGRCDGVARTVAKAKNEMDQDKAQVEQLKASVRRELKNAENAAVTFESARSSGPSPKLAQFLRPFFRATLQSLESRANEYKRDIDEIEEYLRAQLPSKPRGKTMEDIMKRLHDYFLVVASQMAVQHDAVRQLRDDYLAQLRQRSPDAPNPFEEAAKKEAALKSRNEFKTLSAAEAALNNLHSQTVVASNPNTSSLSTPGGGSSTFFAATTPAATLGSTTPATNLSGFQTPGVAVGAGNAAVGGAATSLFDNSADRRRKR